MAGFDKTIFMNSSLVAKIPKNKLEELHVSVLRNNVVDIRIYFYFPNDPVPKPTKKGIWVSFKYVPDIVKAFRGLADEPSKDIALEFEKQKAEEKLRVYTADFKGNRIIHIRTFYKKDNEFQPGRGVSFTMEMLNSVIEALNKAESIKEK